MYYQTKINRTKCNTFFNKKYILNPIIEEKFQIHLESHNQITKKNYLLNFNKKKKKNRNVKLKYIIPPSPQK